MEHKASVDMWADEIQVAGTVAYEWGINTETVSVPDHPEPFKNKGKITLVLRKQLDGSWKQALESWNSSPQTTMKGPQHF
jgi:ketosteroid isomerase-like protein